MKAEFLTATLVLPAATTCRDLPEASYPELDGTGEGEPELRGLRDR